MSLKKIENLDDLDRLISRSGNVNSSNKSQSKSGPSKDYIDVINQMFAEFELAYHNQYHKAFPDEGALKLAKKYWLSCLGDFSPELLLAATREVVKTQKFLPTIANIIDACTNALSLFGLPESRDAYVEACRAPLPKSAQKWSHPAVYLAAKATGWYELANQAEAKIFPLFDFHYAQLTQQVLRGEDLEIITATPLPASDSVALSPEENQSRLQSLKASLKLS